MESSQLGIGPKTAQYIEDDNRRHTWQYLPRIGEFKLHLPKFTAYGDSKKVPIPGLGHLHSLAYLNLTTSTSTRTEYFP